jgi:FtsH-binding integral membrane protein
MGKRRLWKVYFFLMVALTIGGYLLPLFVSAEPSGEEFEDLVLIPLYLAQLVGLFGFAYWRAIGTRRIWQWIFGATVLETVWMLYGFVTEVPPSELGSFFMIGLAATIVPLLALLFWALFSYAFRAPSLWAKAT